MAFVVLLLVVPHLGPSLSAAQVTVAVATVAAEHAAPDALRVTDRHEPTVAPAPFLKRLPGLVLPPTRGVFRFDRNRFAWRGYVPAGYVEADRGPRIRRYCLMVSEDPPRA